MSPPIASGALEQRVARLEEALAALQGSGAGTDGLSGA